MASGVREVFGREGELAAVSSFLDDTASGPAALLLEGEAGVGKTTLWREGVEAAGGRGFRVLECQPVESEAKLSFAALGDLLGPVVDQASATLPGQDLEAVDPLDRVVWGHGSEIALGDPGRIVESACVQR
jgi:hypothetical protein